MAECESLVDYLLSDDTNLFEVNDPIPSRFSEPLTSHDLTARIEDTLSSNSIKKAKWAVNIFRTWLLHRQQMGIINGMHVFKSFEEMTAGELNSQLQYFIFEVRKTTGERYPSSSLRDIIQGIGYYLTNILHKSFHIFRDTEFRETLTALDAAMKEANKQKVLPQGNGPSTPISGTQEEDLWKSGVLGTDKPTTLLRTIFFLNGKFFGLRGGKEQRDLEWNVDIKLTQTDYGEALVYNNQHAKNYTGGLKQRMLKSKEVKAFGSPDRPERCIVQIYKEYAKKRQNIAHKAFYLKPLIKYNDNGWYGNAPLGHNTLSSMTKTICELAGVQGGNFVNHSLKKTTGTRLKHLTETQRKAQTGNRSTAQSVYEVVTDEDFLQTSKELYKSTNCSIATSSSATSSMATSEYNECLNISVSQSKKMKLEIDGNTNKVTISFS